MAPITGSNWGPAINLGTWICIVAASFCVLVKLYTKWASLSAIATTVATSKQVSSGLGKHSSALDDTQLDQFFKANYVTQIFYVITVFMTKRTAILSLSGAVLAWKLIAIFVLAFQCRLPNPWILVDNTCINLPAFWTVNTVLDITSQLALALLPVWLLRGLNTSSAKKRKAMLWFSPAILTMPVSSARLAFIFTLFSSHTQDITWTAFNLELATNIHSSLALVSVCIPFSKIMIDNLAVGLISNDLRGLTIGLTGLALHSSNGKLKSADPTPARSRPSQRSWLDRRSYTVFDRSPNTANRSTITSSPGHLPEAEELRHLRSPNADRMIIRCDRTLTVSSEATAAGPVSRTPPVTDGRPAGKSTELNTWI